MAVSNSSSTQIALNAATATQLAPMRRGRSSCIVKNLDATNTVYVGYASTVSSAIGMELKPGESWPTQAQNAIYAIAAANTPTVAVTDEWDYS